MQRLQGKAMQTRNHIGIEILASPELRELAGRVNDFALTEIKKQIIIAKKEKSERRTSTWVDECECHTYRRDGLPCMHMVPVDGTAIPLDAIAPYWRLHNWEQGWLSFNSTT